MFEQNMATSKLVTQKFTLILCHFRWFWEESELHFHKMFDTWNSGDTSLSCLVTVAMMIFFSLFLKDITWNDTWVLYHVIAYFIMLARCGSVLFGHGGNVQILRTASLTRTIFGCERIFQMFL